MKIGNIVHAKTQSVVAETGKRALAIFTTKPLRLSANAAANRMRMESGL